MFLVKGTEDYDLSHQILHLSFGPEENLKSIRKEFPNSGILN